MASEDTVSFLASLQAENAALRARCEQLQKQVWEAEQERDRVVSFSYRQEQAIKEHLLRCEQAEATVTALKNLWHEADAQNKAICAALHEGEHAFDPVTKAKALVTTVDACEAAGFITQDGKVIGTCDLWCVGTVTINGQDTKDVKEWDSDDGVEWRGIPSVPVWSTRTAAEAANGGVQ
jgi:hypothetical protein